MGGVTDCWDRRSSRFDAFPVLQPNKQSIVLDLKSDDGETTLTSRHRMAQESRFGRTGPWRPVCQCRRRVVDLAGVQAVVQHADVAIGPLREALWRLRNAGLVECRQVGRVVESFVAYHPQGDMPLVPLNRVTGAVPA